MCFVITVNTEARKKAFVISYCTGKENICILKNYYVARIIGNPAMSNIYPSLPDKVSCEVKKKMQLEQ